MTYIDISWPLSDDSTEYKNRKTFTVTWHAQFPADTMNESIVCMGTHTGTHIEAPSHFIQGGKTLDQFPLETFTGTCHLLDLSSVKEVITKEDIVSYKIEPGSHVLLKTSNSLLSPTGPFEPNFVYLSDEAAEYLATKQLKTVGIDYLAIERNLVDHPAHKALLSKDILIIEGLRLADVKEGTYRISCFPLKLLRTEASPVRAVLST